MDGDATVRLLVAAPDPERASSVATAVEAAAPGHEARAATTGDAVAALAGFDADCVVGDAADAGRLLESLDAEHPELPVVLFSGSVRSSGGSTEASPSPADGRVVETVRADPTASVDALLERVESAVGTRDRGWYRSLLDSTTDVIAVLGPDGTFQYVNATVEPMLGYDPDDLVGTSAFDLVHEDDREEVIERFFDFAAERGPEHPTETFRVRDADGRWRWVESTGQNRFRGASTEGYVICVREITERREREQELARYETIVESAPVGLFVLDEAGVVTWANEDFSETLGIPRDDLEGTPFTDLVEAGYYDEAVVEEYLEKVRTLLSSDNDVEEVAYPVETYHQDGERSAQDAHITLLPLEDGEFRGTVVAYRDVTKQREYEAELERQNERLDRFASTVSHDLRNPLSVAKGRVQLARESGELDHLDHVEEAHDRMESLVEGLLALARDEEGVADLRSVDLRAAAETAWEPVDDGRATLSIRDDVAVVADPDRLRQLLENLFRNAVEHGAADGETVAVTVGALDGREGFYVEDDGRGVPPSDEDRVFEHGYTTAEDGTGFGLGIVQTVADDHGWTVTLATGEDGGARFEIATDGEDEAGDCEGERGAGDGDGGGDDGRAADRSDGGRPADG